MSKTVRWEVRFGECEHTGDLDHYVQLLKQAGAEIESQSMDSFDEEAGSAIITIPAEEEFKRAFIRNLHELDLADFITSTTKL